MNTAFFIVLGRQDPGFDPAVNAKFLARDAPRPAKVAKVLGLRPLDEYVSYAPDEARAMMEDLGSDADGIDAMEFPDQQWYDPLEGLNLVGKLARHVRANPSAVKNAKGVLADLDEYRAAFEQAKTVGARRNLQVDF